MGLAALRLRIRQPLHRYQRRPIGIEDVAVEPWGDRAGFGMAIEVEYGSKGSSPYTG
jgi:hypothetical protein